MADGCEIFSNGGGAPVAVPDPWPRAFLPAHLWSTPSTAAAAARDSALVSSQGALGVPRAR